MCNRLHIKIKGGTLDNWLHFYLSEPRVLAEAAGCKSCFALTLISQTRHIHMWRDMLMNYLSLKYSESILAFQLQFGTYEAESTHFRWEKEKMPFNPNLYGGRGQICLPGSFFATAQKRLGLGC